VQAATTTKLFQIRRKKNTRLKVKKRSSKDVSCLRKNHTQLKTQPTMDMAKELGTIASKTRIKITKQAKETIFSGFLKN